MAEDMAIAWQQGAARRVCAVRGGESGVLCGLLWAAAVVGGDAPLWPRRDWLAVAASCGHWHRRHAGRRAVDFGQRAAAGVADRLERLVGRIGAASWVRPRD